ncbi:MAG: Hvo_1808 family surface protein, partial [Candidatus Bathyarchaeia archaeon]
SDHFWELAQQEYEAMYILDESSSARELTKAFYSGAILGFYDSVLDEMVLVLSNREQGVDESILAHELNHALTDQYFPRIYRFNSDLTDKGLAVQAVIEGDAVRTEDLYVQRCSSGIYTDCSSTVATGSISVTPPLGFRLLVFFPYSEGPPMIREIQALGGIEGLDSLYSTFPQSTEQIIHPQKYLSDTPRNLEVSDTSDELWTVLGDDILGEAGIYAMFRNKGVVSPIGAGYISTPSEGWDGDLLRIYKKGGEYGYVWKTIWDTENDAIEFQQAYEQLLLKIGAVDQGRFWRIDTNDYVVTQRQLNVVTIVNAPDSRELGKIYTPLDSLPVHVTVEYQYHNLKDIETIELGSSLSLKLGVVSDADTSTVLVTTIRDETDRLVSISFATVQLHEGVPLDLETTWVPPASGHYVVTTFAWHDLKDPTPLSQESTDRILVMP